MMPSRTRKKGTHKHGTTRDSVSMLLPNVLDFVDKARQGRLYPTRRMKCIAQGSTTKFLRAAGVGEGNTASGGDIYVLTAYTSTVVGAAGGPAVGDDMLLYATDDGNWVVVGKVNY